MIKVIDQNSGFDYSGMSYPLHTAVAVNPYQSFRPGYDTELTQLNVYASIITPASNFSMTIRIFEGSVPTGSPKRTATLAQDNSTYFHAVVFVPPFELDEDGLYSFQVVCTNCAVVCMCVLSLHASSHRVEGSCGQHLPAGQPWILRQRLRLCQSRYRLRHLCQLYVAPLALVLALIHPAYRTCVSGAEYQHAPPNPSTNRDCRPYTVCASGIQYETVAATTTSNRACATLTTCSVSEVEIVAPTTTSNRKCSPGYLDQSSTYSPLGAPSSFPTQGLFQTFTPAYSGQLFRIRLYLSSPTAGLITLSVFHSSNLIIPLFDRNYNIAAGAATYMNLDFPALTVLQGVTYRFTILCATCSTYWTSTNPYLRGYMGWPGNDVPTSPNDMQFFTYLAGLPSFFHSDRY